MTRTRTRIAAALATAGLAFVAAAPADAAYRTYEPTESGDAPVERTMASDDTTSGGCSVTLNTGQTIVYPEGHSFSVINKSTGKKHTFTCQNGKWVETVEANDSPYASNTAHHDAEYAYAQP
ncbi:MAG TPA: hypothetical protein VFZ89_09785 [Solirubrobacteraceae bacterium]